MAKPWLNIIVPQLQAKKIPVNELTLKAATEGCRIGIALVLEHMDKFAEENVQYKPIIKYYEFLAKQFLRSEEESARGS